MFKKNKAKTKEQNIPIEKNEYFDPIDNQNSIKELNKKTTTKGKIKNASKKTKFNLKKWFFGVGKEFNRISWPLKGKILEDFIIVVVICLFFALIFFAIDMILVSI